MNLNYNIQIITSREKLSEFLSTYFSNSEEIVDEFLLESIAENDINNFNNCLTLVRKSAGHRKFANPLVSGQRKVLLQVINSANIFCVQFELSKSEGYIAYIKLGLKLIGNNFRLNKFIFKEPQIYERYEEYHTLQNNPHKKLSEKIHKFYCLEAGVNVPFDVNFIYTAKVVKENGFKYKTHINAQIQLMVERIDKFPEPYNLHTEKSITRTLEYTKRIVEVESDYDKLIKVTLDK